jgi:metal-dependent amidase/aminoacylase/carboxypeptidase family protein
MTLTDTGWRDDAETLLPDLIELRRAIHAEPELGLQNPKTLAKIKAALAGLPRGDMDALPLNEDTGLDYSSNTAGAMHACGHDTHVAMLVGAAKMLCAKRDQLAGTVQFMFQPGEEGHHGARFMLDDGLIDPLPDAAFALHIMPNAAAGVIRRIEHYREGRRRSRVDAA